MNTSLTSNTTPFTKENATAYIEPRYSVDRSDEQTLLRVELPGVPKDGLTLTIENRELFLEGTTAQQRPESWKTLHRESLDRTYQLRLRLGENVDEGSIGAAMANGVLTLTIPVAQPVKPRKISVK